jgi:hypothetical protein
MDCFSVHPRIPTFVYRHNTKLYETKHDFCQIAKVRDNKNHASFICQLKKNYYHMKHP